jgi:hypothetical protein
VSATLESWRLPAGLTRAAAVVDGGGVVVAGGLGSGAVSTSTVMRLDTRSGAAQRIGTMATAVHDAGGAVLGGHDFVFGGGAATTVATVQRVGTGAAIRAGTLPRARSDLSVASTPDVAYIVGGFDGHAMDDDVLATTDGTTFHTVAHLPVPVRYAATTFADGAVWVIGGQLGTAESTKSGGQSDAIQRVDPTSGAATVVGHLPTTLGHASAFTLGGQVFVAGGQAGTTPTATITHIDTATMTVTQVGTLPSARSDTAVAVDGDTAWLIGGETTSAARPLDTVVRIRLQP